MSEATVPARRVGYRICLHGDVDDIHISPEQFDKICSALKADVRILEIDDKIIMVSSIRYILPLNPYDPVR